VPAGRRLVLEFISAQVDVPVGQRVALKISATVGGRDAAHDFVLARVGMTDRDWFVATHAARLYADPGTTVRVLVLRTSGEGTGNAIVNLVGQLVPLDGGASSGSGIEGREPHGR
jgi:hypothetical protein